MDSMMKFDWLLYYNRATPETTMTDTYVPRHAVPVKAWQFRPKNECKGLPAWMEGLFVRGRLTGADGKYLVFTSKGETRVNVIDGSWVVYTPGTDSVCIMGEEAFANNYAVQANVQAPDDGPARPGDTVRFTSSGFEHQKGDTGIVDRLEGSKIATVKLPMAPVSKTINVFLTNLEVVKRAGQ